VGVIVAKLTGCKVVVTQHFLEPAHVASGGLLSKMKRAIHQWIGGHIDYRICVSRAALTSMQARGDVIAKTDTDVTVIHNGIDVDAIKASVSKSRTEICTEFGISESKALISCAARLEAEKDISLLINAFKVLLESGIDATLIVAGEGSQKGQLSDQIERSDLTDKVILVGFRTDVPSITAASSLFVLPASNEPFGLVLLEAMSLGVPVVAANSGGPLEIITDPSIGNLFESGSCSDLAEKLAESLNTRERNNEYEVHSALFVREFFSAATMARSTVTAYRSVTGSIGNPC
jgi:glycosyltransferase involved in cell wall biosynthesis